MDEANYAANVRERASREYHPELVDLGDFQVALEKLIEAAKDLDEIKKALFYGKATTLFEPVEDPMPFITPGGKGHTVFHALLGIWTEAGELAEAFQKSTTEGSGGIDDVNLLEELGDLNWYRVLALSELGQTEASNRAQNDAKLELRFGSVFSAERAKERDLQLERKSLETGVYRRHNESTDDYHARISAASKEA